MRYLKDIRWRLSSDAAKAYLGVGRKVLGGLLERLSGTGVDIGARSVVLEDGTKIRVMATETVPIVEITAGSDIAAQEAPTRSCEMFMESGQLDLGATVASLSTDSAATITFNTRTARDAKFNGRIRVQEFNNGERYRVRGIESLPDDGSTTVVDDVLGTDDEVLVTRAAKKTAQFLLPASCWSGLMRRFVQAKYGFPGAIYGSVSDAAPSLPHVSGTAVSSALTPALQVTAYDNAVVSTLSMNFRNHQTDGIVDFGLLDLWFIRVLPYESLGGKTVEFRRVLYTECAEMLRQHLIKLGRAHPDFHKLSTFMLSQAFPALTPAAIRPLPEDRLVAAVGPYGWKFSDSGRAAAIVSMTKIEDEDEYVRSADFVTHQMTFAYNDSDGLPDFTISSSTPVTAWRCGYYSHPYVFSPLHGFKREGATGMGALSNEWALQEPPGVEDNTPTAVFDCDYPLYCWFEGDTLVVLRRDFATDTPSGEFVAGQCLAESGTTSVVYSVAGDCPCDEHPCASTDVTCDAATDSFVRTVRDGYYTSYTSTVDVHRTYPSYSDDFDVLGASGYGWMSRETSASAHVLGDDTSTSSSEGGFDSGAGYIFHCDGPPDEYPPTITYACYPVDNDPVDTAEINSTYYQKTASFGSAFSIEATDAAALMLVIPQYDSSSVAVKKYILEGSIGSATWTSGAVFSLPHREDVDASGSTFQPTGSGVCGEGFQEFVEDANSYSGTSEQSICLDDTCYDDCSGEGEDRECVCQWEDGVVTSETYTRMDETLDTYVWARGAALQLDAIVNVYRLHSAGTVAATPACTVHWNPGGATSGAPIKSETGAVASNYVDAGMVAPAPAALYTIARVWQSDGGDFASSDSLQYTALQNPVTQHSGYSAKTQELFSFIGWA